MLVLSRRRAGNGLEPRAAWRAWPRPGLEQRQRVGVPRLTQHRLDRPALHDHAGVHDDHTVTMPGDHGQVVADEQDGHLRFRPEAVDEGEDGRLHGDVERRGRLIGDDESRRTADRHRDHCTLPLAARELERIGSRRAFGLGQAHALEQIDRAPARVALVQTAMEHQRFGDLRAHAVQRIERRHRLLEDHGDAVAAQLQHILFRGADQLPPLEADRTREPRAHGRQRHQRERGHRLAGAGFAHHAEALALAKPKGRPLDDALQSSGRRHVDREIGDLEQHQLRAFSFGSSASRRPSPSRLRPSTLSAIATPG